MRIAIITFHRAYNCGAMLQAWALKTVLERMGHTVEFPEGNDLGRLPPKSPLSARNRTGPLFRRVRSFCWRLVQTMCGKRMGVVTGTRYDRFRIKHLPETPLGMEELGQEFDVVLLGSDQVLNPRIVGWSSRFLCEEVSEELPKVAYAASVGDGVLDDGWTSRILKALSGFRAVSVREPFCEYAAVADPTLLLTAEDYHVLYKDKKASPHGRYLFMYSCTFTDFEIGMARQIACRLKLRLVIAHPWGRHCRRDVPEMVKTMSPELLVEYIANAEYVIAGSFHATALSVLHGKKFITLRVQVDVGDSRPAAFLKRLGLMNRLVNPQTDIESAIVALTSSMPSTVSDILNTERIKSIRWLADALESCGKGLR